MLLPLLHCSSNYRIQLCSLHCLHKYNYHSNHYYHNVNSTIILCQRSVKFILVIIILTLCIYRIKSLKVNFSRIKNVKWPFKINPVIAVYIKLFEVS